VYEYVEYVECAGCVEVEVEVELWGVDVIWQGIIAGQRARVRCARHARVTDCVETRGSRKNTLHTTYRIPHSAYL